GDRVHRALALHVRLHVRGGRALVGCVLEEKRGFQLSLPRRVGEVRRTRGHRSSSIKIEQLGGHLLNGRACPVALLRPALAAEGVEARRRRVAGDVCSGAVTLYLIDAIQRDVEPVAPLVLDDGCFDDAFAEEDLVYTTVYTNPV